MKKESHHIIISSVSWSIALGADTPRAVPGDKSSTRRPSSSYMNCHRACI